MIWELKCKLNSIIEQQRKDPFLWTIWIVIEMLIYYKSHSSMIWAMVGETWGLWKQIKFNY
jgi:hypothetical protein